MLIATFFLNGSVFGVSVDIISKLTSNDPRLTHLRLGGPSIDDESARKIIEALKENIHLTYLSIEGDRINPDLKDEINELMTANGLKHRKQCFRNRRLNTCWYLSSDSALTGNRATHAVMCSWGLAPQLRSVVWTVLISGVRIDFIEVGRINGVIALPNLPNEIWIEILKYFRCRDFVAQQQALGAP